MTTSVEAGRGAVAPVHSAASDSVGTWWLAILTAAPAIALATVFLARGLVVEPTVDGAVFALIGDALMDDRLPYRDLFDHKPPGIYLLNAGSGLLFGAWGPWAAAWLVSWLSTVVALVVLAWALLRIEVPRGGIVLAMLGTIPLFAGYRFVLGGGQTESSALAFVL